MGETIETTLWRELREEIGLSETDFIQVTPYPKWTVHAYTEADASKSRIGQVHRWYFLELKPAVEIDLGKATEQEASAWRFTTFAEAVAECEPTKKPVYEELASYYAENNQCRFS